MTQEKIDIPPAMADALERAPTIYGDSLRALKAMLDNEIEVGDIESRTRVIELDARIQQMKHDLSDLVQARTMVPSNVAYELQILDHMFSGLDDYRWNFADVALPAHLPSALRCADFDARQALLDTVDTALPIATLAIDAPPDHDLAIPEYEAEATEAPAPTVEARTAQKLTSQDFRDRWLRG